RESKAGCFKNPPCEENFGTVESIRVRVEMLDAFEQSSAATVRLVFCAQENEAR
ncbi:hypothetical protein A2U01_0000577, partial [Trifolium medium]|nr:hypothetical protein [Trifolium medium]